MKNNFLLILTFFYCTLTWTQVKFEAEVSKNKLGVNENLRIDFKMNKDGDNFSPPNFEGFNIVGGPNQSVSNSWINGTRTFSKTYSYFLSPIKEEDLQSVRHQLKLREIYIKLHQLIFKLLKLLIHLLLQTVQVR